MSAEDARTLVEDALARGVDDWLYLGELYSIASNTGAANALDTRTTALGLVTELLTSGLMVAGELIGAGFRAWETPVAQSVTRIATEWLSRSDPVPPMGEIVWFSNTDKGEAVGEAVLRRESQS